MLPNRCGAITPSTRDMHYLQFWSVSLFLTIELEITAVFYYSSLEPVHAGNGLRRFVLRDDGKRRHGWVLLDESWIEEVTNRRNSRQEFILLSEASPEKPEM